jgi:lyso-ornithine lipid O-acyltransferase
VLPGSFIAKDEMARWPLANKLCALQDTVFVSRSPRDAARVAHSMRDVLQRRRSLILFPEGTTSDGRAVAPFKSSLFSVFLGDSGSAWTVQPFTLSLQAVDGRALLLGGNRDGYAFHGDMTMVTHLKHFLGLRGARLRLVLHAPRALSPDEDRKRLAVELHGIVASAL